MTEPVTHSKTVISAAEPAARFVPWAILLLLVALVIGTAFIVVSHKKPVAPSLAPARKSLIQIPGLLKSEGRPFAISPDGARLAYISDDRLFVRNLTQLEPRPREVRQSEGVLDLFWSPDSRSRGYATAEAIYRVMINASEPQRIVEAKNVIGGVWLRDNRIVFSTGASDGLLQVGPSGGAPDMFLPIDSRAHGLIVLPDGKNILFIVQHTTNGVTASGIAVSAGGKPRIVYKYRGKDIINSIAFCPSGHILFDLQGARSLWALPFSVSKLQARGEPVIVYSGAAFPSLANDGTLLFQTRSAPAPRRFARVNRTGKVLATFGTAQIYQEAPRWSPDGKRVLSSVFSPKSGSADLWVDDGTNSYALTQGGDRVKDFASWSPDASAVLFRSGMRRIGPGQLKLIRLSDREEIDLGMAAEGVFTSSGESFVYLAPVGLWAAGPFDIRSTYLAAGSKNTLHCRINAQLSMVSISPDDRFLAYAANEGGLFQIYVTPFPECDRRLRISMAKGGFWPAWRKLGEQLFLYFADDTGSVFETPVSENGDQLARAEPRKCFPREPDGIRSFRDFPPGFDVSADGQEFLVTDLPEGVLRETFLTLVQNWSRDIARK